MATEVLGKIGSGKAIGPEKKKRRERATAVTGKWQYGDGQYGRPRRRLSRSAICWYGFAGQVAIRIDNSQNPGAGG